MIMRCLLLMLLSFLAMGSTSCPFTAPEYTEGSTAAPPDPYQPNNVAPEDQNVGGQEVVAQDETPAIAETHVPAEIGANAGGSESGGSDALAMRMAQAACGFYQRCVPNMAQEFCAMLETPGQGAGASLEGCSVDIGLAEECIALLENVDCMEIFTNADDMNVCEQAVVCPDGQVAPLAKL